MARDMSAARGAIRNQAALVKGSPAAITNMKKVRAAKWKPGSRKRRPQISQKSAMRAFNRFYSVNNPRYKSAKSAKAARTRDLCSNNKGKPITDRRYRRSPHRYNYKGVDTGSRCPKGMKVRKSKSRKAITRGRALAALRK